MIMRMKRYFEDGRSRMFMRIVGFVALCSGGLCYAGPPTANLIGSSLVSPDGALTSYVSSSPSPAASPLPTSAEIVALARTLGADRVSQIGVDAFAQNI